MNLSSPSEPRLKLREWLRGATRDAILEAAARVFSSGGATHARMEDIAASAGVAVGTVYNYFEDRTALVTALLDGRRRDMFEALDAAVAPAAGGATHQSSRGLGAGPERLLAPPARRLDANPAPPRGLLGGK